MRIRKITMHFEWICVLKQELNYAFKLQENYCRVGAESCFPCSCSKSRDFFPSNCLKLLNSIWFPYNLAWVVSSYLQADANWILHFSTVFSMNSKWIWYVFIVVPFWKLVKVVLVSFKDDISTGLNQWFHGLPLQSFISWILDFQAFGICIPMHWLLCYSHYAPLWYLKGKWEDQTTYRCPTSEGRGEGGRDRQETSRHRGREDCPGGRDHVCTEDHGERERTKDINHWR